MRIHFIGSAKPAAQQPVQQLIDRYGQSDLAEADYVVPVGGDGTTLSALYAVLRLARQPVFAMRLPDSVGALGNAFDYSNLQERLEAARRVSVRPLKAEITCVTGSAVTVFGINEIAVTRLRLQAAKLCLRIGETERPSTVIGDGLLIATPVGSTGYNRSAGGPILPLRSDLLALTGLAVHRRSDWCNTVLDDRATIDIEVIDPIRRPVRIETSAQEVRDISRAEVSCSHDRRLTLLLEGR
jgi:NAD+ kinase